MVGLGSSGVGIGITVRLLDRFTTNAGRISTAMASMQSKMNIAMASNLRQARRWGIGMTVVGAIGLGLMGKAHSAFRKFDWEMTTVAAVTHKTKEELKDLDAIVKSLAQRSIFNPQEIASASTRLAKAGYELKQIEDAMEGIVLLGTATDTPIGGKTGVGDMVVKIMRQFDLPAQATGHVADVITKAVNSAAMDMDDAFEALKFLGKTASEMGISLEDTMAMVAVLANAGVPQGIAGRGLVNSLIKMAVSVGSMASKSNIKALTTLGLKPSDIKDAAGNLLPIVQIIERLIETTQKLGNVEKISALSKWMRIRGGRAILPLMQNYSKSGAKTFAQMSALLKSETAGEALSITTQRMKAAEGVFRVMGDVFDTLKVTWGEAIDQVLTPFFKIITEILRKMIAFVSTPIGKWTAIAVTGFFAIVTVLGLVVIAVSTLGLAFTKGLSVFRPMISSMIWGMNMFAASVMRAVGAQKILNTISWVGAGGVGAVKGMRGFQSAATMAAMTGGTIGKVGGKGILAIIGRAFTGLVRFIGPLGMIVTILGMIIGWKNLLRGIVVVIGTIGNVITLIFDAIIGLFTGRIFEAFNKFADIQSTLGTKGMFAPEPTEAKRQTKGTVESVVQSGRRGRDYLNQDYRSEANPAMFKQQIVNNIIIDDEVIQREVKNFNNKSLSEILTN